MFTLMGNSMLLSSNYNKTRSQFPKIGIFSFIFLNSKQFRLLQHSLCFIHGVKKGYITTHQYWEKICPHLPNTRNGAHLKGIKFESLRLTRFLQVISRNTLSPCCHQSTQFYLRIRSRPLPLDLGGFHIYLPDSGQIICLVLLDLK